MNETGYRNLIHLVSKGYLEGFYYKPRIDLDLLREHSEGLIATSGCLSSMVSPRDHRRPARHRLAARRGVLAHLPGPLLPRDPAPRDPRAGPRERRAREDGGRPAAAAASRPTTRTTSRRATTSTTTRCSASAPPTNLDDPKRFRFDGQGFYVKDGDEMAEVFHDHPSAVANTLEIAERCDARARPMGTLPHARVPGAGGHDARGGARARRPGRGLRARLGLAPGRAAPAEARRVRASACEHELGVITVDGLRRLLPDRRRLHRLRAQATASRSGPGRGSSAGSLVAWSPRHHRRRSDRVRHHLRALPEPRAHLDARHRRRLLHARARPGDPLRRREVRRPTGDEGRRVAQIITFGTLQARAAMRDVGPRARACRSATSTASRS